MPLAAERSEKALIAAAAKREERWRKVLSGAAEQSRRLNVPALQGLRKPAEAFSSTESDIKLLLCEKPEAPSLRSCLQGRTAKSVALAIGPEGGWTEAEISAAEKSKFAAVSMGSLVLRTETAAVAALASLNYAMDEK